MAETTDVKYGYVGNGEYITPFQITIFYNEHNLCEAAVAALSDRAQCIPISAQLDLSMAAAACTYISDDVVIFGDLFERSDIDRLFERDFQMVHIMTDSKKYHDGEDYYRERVVTFKIGDIFQHTILNNMALGPLVLEYILFDKLDECRYCPSSLASKYFCEYIYSLGGDYFGSIKRLCECGYKTYDEIDKYINIAAGMFRERERIINIIIRSGTERNKAYEITVANNYCIDTDLYDLARLFARSKGYDTISIRKLYDNTLVHIDVEGPVRVEQLKSNDLLIAATKPINKISDIAAALLRAPGGHNLTGSYAADAENASKADSHDADMAEQASEVTYNSNIAEHVEVESHDVTEQVALDTERARTHSDVTEQVAVDTEQGTVDTCNDINEQGTLNTEHVEEAQTHSDVTEQVTVDTEQGALNTEHVNNHSDVTEQGTAGTCNDINEQDTALNTEHVNNHIDVTEQGTTLDTEHVNHSDVTEQVTLDTENVKKVDGDIAISYVVNSNETDANLTTKIATNAGNVSRATSSEINHNVTEESVEIVDDNNSANKIIASADDYSNSDSDFDDKVAKFRAKIAAAKAPCSEDIDSDAAKFNSDIAAAKDCSSTDTTSTDTLSQINAAFIAGETSLENEFNKLKDGFVGFIKKL